MFREREMLRRNVQGRTEREVERPMNREINCAATVRREQEGINWKHMDTGQGKKRL